MKTVLILFSSILSYRFFATKAPRDKTDGIRIISTDKSLSTCCNSEMAQVWWFYQKSCHVQNVVIRKAYFFFLRRKIKCIFNSFKKHANYTDRQKMTSCQVRRLPKRFLVDFLVLITNLPVKIAHHDRFLRYILI